MTGLPTYLAWLVTSLVLFLGSPALAQSEQDAGAASGTVSRMATPGVFRVGLPRLIDPSLAVAADAGFGHTEKLPGETGSHQRYLGSLSLAWAVERALLVGAELEGRYDKHPKDQFGPDDGLSGSPRLFGRYSFDLGPSFGLGTEAVLWFPGKNAPSIAFNATTVDLELLPAWFGSSTAVGARLGFRYDNSAKAAPNADRLRAGDRLALGLSDSNGVLLGLGASQRIGQVELLGEATFDLLVGSKAPAVSESPIRVSAGARWAVSDPLALELMGEGTLSDRPDVGPGIPLVPVEPQITVQLGLRYVVGLLEPKAEPPPPPPPPPPAPKPTTADVRGTVQGPDGPLANATVILRSGDQAREVTTDAQGNYHFEDVKPGTVVLRVEAPDFSPQERKLEITAGGKLDEGVQLHPKPPVGQLRGLVRSFQGKALSATVRVDPLGVEVTTDADGYFQVDVPPGDYHVIISAEGFAEQNRAVHVDQNGVTVLNADLRSAR